MSQSLYTLTAARAKLRDHWGHTEFRTGQEKAVKSVLKGRETLVLLPTGGGKSLCYQLPAVMFEGVTLVISPLIALMQDQVEQLNRAGIRSAFINSTLSAFEVEQRLVNARNHMYKLLYLAPERLKTEMWQNMAGDLNISLIAIDEAHCISQWGHDFRPAYRKIREHLSGFDEKARWIALTATATPEVREDIIRNLNFKDPVVVAGGFQRPNLQWWVGISEQKKKLLLQAASRGVKKGSGIIYAGTRRDCGKIAAHLTRRNIDAKEYHAGLDSEERQAVQRGWLEDVFPVVVATNAFGMGVDKPDCRFVIHYDMPYTVEAYYQEAGRAGRDGKEAYPLLLYKESDYHVAKARLLRSYPDLKELEILYDVICDELNLAVGSSQIQPEPLSARSLKRRSSLEEGTIMAGLKVLERLGIMDILNMAEPKLGLQFTVDRETLREKIDRAPPVKSEFLDLLFRQFGPEAFRKIHYLNLSYLLEKLKVNRNGLKKAIRVFSDQDQILSYHWIEGEPLVQMRNPRSRRFPAGRRDVEGYRDILMKKLDQMKAYAETETCRETYLRVYFGETGVRDCGHCDTCRGTGPDNRPPEDRDLAVVREALTVPVSLQELARETKWSFTKLKRVVRFLIKEGRIRTDENDRSKYLWKE